jgi:DNA-binding CsgD family transcriptional regulator
MVFVGRRAELDELLASYERARSGKSGVVSLEGPAGIGKTALIQAFLDETRPPVVVAASGDPDEAMLPFGVIAQLVHASVPSTGGSLAALRDLHAGTEPITVGRLLLDGLAELQTSGGVVVLVVEDLHWVDLSSAMAVRFALRRLSGDRVLAVVSSRPGGPADADEGWRRLLGDRGRRVRLGGLSVDELADLATSTTSVGLDRSAVRRLWSHTGGNPLYARCVLEELDADELVRSGSLAVPPSLSSLLMARLAGCDQETVALVSAAAVLGEECPLTHAVSLAGVDHPVDALSAAIEAGFLVEARPGDLHEIGFTHSLVRAAVYADMSPSARAALHRGAARLVAGPAQMAHRVAAAASPDDELATELVELAEGEIAAGTVGAAAAHLWQAAEVTADPTRREEWMLWAFGSWLDAGHVHEIAARHSQLEAMPPSWPRDVIRGVVALMEGRLDAARSALNAGLAQVEGDDNKDVADELRGYLMSVATLDWDWQEALRLSGAVRGSDPYAAVAGPAMAMAMAGRGQEALDSLAKVSPADATNPFVVLARAYVRLWVDDPAGARDVIETNIRARISDVESLLPSEHFVRAEACYRLGALDETLVAADLGLSLLDDTGRATGVGAAWGLALAVYAAAARGDWAVAERMAQRSDAMAAPMGSRSMSAYAAAARWALAVAQDDPTAMLRAATALDPLADFPEPGVFPFGPVLAEALWRAGRLREASTHVAAYEDRAQRVGRASALLGAARVRGSVMADAGELASALDCFDGAAEMADTSPVLLETARYRTAHGQVLARAGQRAAAVAQMQVAVATLEVMGATPYLERAKRVLAQLGHRASRRSAAGELTATEAVVARLVASGLANKQVAEQLYISRKGVEYHLANVYRKLGVHNRTELAATLGQRGNN